MKPIAYEGDKTKVLSGAGRGETFAAVLARRLSRRGALKGAAGAAALAVTGPRLFATASAQDATPAAEVSAASGLDFEPIALDTNDSMLVANGYQVRPFLRWGEALFADSPAFDPMAQTAASQERQFGYNCDFIAFLPLPQGSDSSDHGLLVVNHEYTNPELMFSGYLTPNPEFDPEDEEAATPEYLSNPSKDIVDVELAAHGLSIVEIQRDEAGEWQIVTDSPLNRRITGTTPIDITGAAAGHDLLKTSADAEGAHVIGTLNNCAGGITPWGTIVSGEENFQQYFANLAKLSEENPAYASHSRFDVPEGSSERRWEEFYDRFDVSKEPNEPFRYGWGVEFDPYDPTSTPKKRTAMGRNKHEGHTSFLAPGGQVAIYTGDDERFEYAYKFVSAGSFDPNDRAANLDLLDVGTLYVAKFNDDGSGEWLPLVYGEGPLTEANGFTSQGDVLINTRFAADALGATKMDRPEDFETNPVNKKVYLVCTNNNARTLDDADKANPRPYNLHGHIVEITEEGDDHAATAFNWDMFMLCGAPEQGSTYFAGFDQDMVSPISAPDNIMFDLAGNLWIATDGLPSNLPGNDGLFVVPTGGDERGYLRQFFSSVPGAEVAGPAFNPDNTALFVSIQHPGEGGNFEEPLSHWPDGGGPARPSVVVISAETPAGRIGSSGA